MNVVLIADSNTERAHALADACQRAGLRPRTAAHGAAALELALGEQPYALARRPPDLSPGTFHRQPPAARRS